MNVKPLFAYVGGKTFLKNKLVEKIEIILNKSKIEVYEEWFAGGLGSFFAVCKTLKDHHIKTVFLNDINEKLISLYSNIYSGNGDKIIKEYMILENKFHSKIPLLTYNRHTTKDKELLKFELLEARDYYKNVVDNFNKSEDSFEQSVYLIFIQNHCFNGIYRENQKGEYNTPFNWEARKVTEELISKKISDIENCFKNFNITFTSLDFEEMKINKNSLIYLDPPYLNEASGENKYNKNSFNLNKQINLINKIKDHDFIYSNHLDKRIIEEFKPEENYSFDYINRKNTISSSAESRKNDKVELLINKKY